MTKFKLHVPVLVLNANFEPLNICSTRRALGLMLAEKASLVQNGRGHIQTVSQKFPAPSIIRLGHMIHRPRPRVKLTKQEIFRRDNYTCQYCGKNTHKLTIDHVIPKKQGGGQTWKNLVAACAQCNHRKGGRTPSQAHMKLINPPKTPSASASYIFGRYLKSNAEWNEYIRGW